MAHLFVSSASRYVRTLRAARKFDASPRCCRRCLSTTAAAATTATPSAPSPRERRRLDVALIGLPNAGKSQLLNRLTNSTVAAVSRKRHTTRSGILGARTVGDAQLLFVDTPGFLRAGDRKRQGVDRGLAGVAAAAASGAVDLSLLVVDAAKNLTDDVKESLVDLMLHALQAKGRNEMVPGSDADDNEEDDSDLDSEDDESDLDENDGDEKGDDVVDPETLLRPKFAIILNKVDLIKPKSNLIPITADIGALADETLRYFYSEKLAETMNGEVVAADEDDVAEEEEESTDEFDEEVLSRVAPEIFYVSALKDDGVDDLLRFLLRQATPSSSDWEVEPGEATNMEPEERVEEVIREKLYRSLNKEVPYHIRQQNAMFRVGRDEAGRPAVSIHQELLVQSKSHVHILRGAGNRTLEHIRRTAERDLASIFGCRVMLHLHVKQVKSKQRRWSI